MKLLHPALHLSPAIRLLLCFILAVTLINVRPTPAKAAGLVTHRDVVGRAIAQLDPQSYLARLLTKYRGAANLGAMFPDWQYAFKAALMPEYNEMDVAHWDPYRDALTAGLLPVFRRLPASPDDVSVEDGRAIAFLFGLIAHQEIDNPWHFLYGNQALGVGLIENKPEKEEDDVGPFETISVHMDKVAKAQLFFKDVAPGGRVEFWVNALIEQKYKDERCPSHPCKWSGWYIPDHQLNDVDWSLPQALTKAYARVGDVDPKSNVDTKYLKPEGLEWESKIITAFKRAYDLESTLAQRMKPPLEEADFKWTTDNVQTWPMGGLEDGARRTAETWKRTWQCMKSYAGPAATAAVSPAPPNGKNGWHTTQPVTATISAADNAGNCIDDAMKLMITGGPDSNKYTTPQSFTFSDDGQHDVRYQTSDSFGAQSKEYEVSVKIDTVAPEVDMALEQARLTRADPVIVHGSDQEPGSGIASLTVNQIPVADGQAFNLLWLPLGEQTLTARAEDNAGWVTEKSTAIEMAATLESLASTVTRMCQESYITDAWVCEWFVSSVRAAAGARDRGDRGTPLAIVRARQYQVKTQAGKAILQRAADLLLGDCAYVMEGLKR